MIIAQQTARSLLTMCMVRRDELLKIPLQLMTAREAEELTALVQYIAQANRELDAAPRGMFDRDGNVK